MGVAINPANDGVWGGDYGRAASGTAANDLLIWPNGKGRGWLAKVPGVRAALAD